MDLISLLMVTLAKSEGDMSSDQKVEIDLMNKKRPWGMLKGLALLQLLQSDLQH
jgi:hypothetical protein